MKTKDKGNFISKCLSHVTSLGPLNLRKSRECDRDVTEPRNLHEFGIKMLYLYKYSTSSKYITIGSNVCKS